MKWLNFLQKIENEKIFCSCSESLHGLEKEAVRIDDKGRLSLLPHPQAFGSKLYNPCITTDFGESQIELITPAYLSEKKALASLNKLQTYVYRNMQEYLWPYSAPPILPREELIDIAKFGRSKAGRQKTLYREGLATRYGKRMQMLSGIHYNFSFSLSFWEKYLSYIGLPCNQEVISEQYLHVVRQFLKEGWLAIFLFGISPAVDRTFLSNNRHSLQKFRKRTWLAPWGTSIRMSHLGYFHKTDLQANISFNTLREYVRDLRYAITTPYPGFVDLKGKQINPNILQIPAEHYARIRPKPQEKKQSLYLEALEKKV
jgi:glutamate--cysteine ligase